jgi:hypothetical protein
LTLGRTMEKGIAVTAMDIREESIYEARREVGH